MRDLRRCMILILLTLTDLLYINFIILFKLRIGNVSILIKVLEGI